MKIDELTCSLVYHESRMNIYEVNSLENAFKSQKFVTRRRCKCNISNVLGEHKEEQSKKRSHQNPHGLRRRSSGILVQKNVSMKNTKCTVINARNFVILPTSVGRSRWMLVRNLQI